MIIIWAFWIALFLYLLAIERRLLFYLWFWQTKQYYIKRVAAEIKEGKWQIVFPKISFLKFILLLIFLFSPIFFPWGGVIVIFLFFGVYLFENLLNVYQKNSRIKFPKLTFKNLPLFLTSHLFVLGAFFYFIFFHSKLSFLDSIFYLVIFDILLFIEVTLVIFLFLLGEWTCRKIIIYLARRKIQKMKNLTIIGITGSYGKTSTKEILYFILSQQFRTKKTPRHLNTDPAIAKFILKNLKSEDEIFIVEMAAYSKGEITLTCRMTLPKIGIICGVNEQHLSLFKTMENLISAEGGVELIQSLPKDGLVVFNGNNKYCQKIYKETTFLRKKITFAVFDSCPEDLQFDLLAKKIQVEKDRIRFEIVEGKKGAEVEVGLVGKHNVENILLAVSVAQELGMSFEEIVKILKDIPQEIGAMQLKFAKEGLNIIDATYSANPDGVISALEYLRVWKGKKVIVMPCLIELGKKAKGIHQKIGEKIGEICDLAIITTLDFFQEIQKSAQEKGMSKNKIIYLSDGAKIYQEIKKFNQKEDVILLEGRVPEKLKQLLKI